MLRIILIIIGICLLIALLPYILAVGVVLLAGYLIISNLDIILSFISVIFSIIVSNLHVIVSVIVALAIVGFIYDKYKLIIERRKNLKLKNKRLKLRDDILSTINKLGMADCEQISNILTEDKNIVMEEMKVLRQLGKVHAEQMNQGQKAGEYVFKSVTLGKQSAYSNYQREEINLN